MLGKAPSLVAAGIATIGFASAVIAAPASAQRASTGCPVGNPIYSEGSGACSTTTSTTTSTPSPTPTATPAFAGAHVRTSYGHGATYAHIYLPAGVKAAKYYTYTQRGVSFGIDHPRREIRQNVAFLNGVSVVKYSIGTLDFWHGRVHVTLKHALNAVTLKIEDSIFEFTAAGRAATEKAHADTVDVYVKITTTTGAIYKVEFPARFLHFVVVKKA